MTPDLNETKKGDSLLTTIIGVVNATGSYRIRLYKTLVELLKEKPKEKTPCRLRMMFHHLH